MVHSSARSVQPPISTCTVALKLPCGTETPTEHCLEKIRAGWFTKILFLFCLSPRMAGWCSKKCGHFLRSWNGQLPPLNSLLLFQHFIHFLKTLFLKRFYLFIFRKKGREGEGEGEKHRCGRDTLIGCLLHAPKARALTGNQTGDLLVCRLSLNPLSHTSQGTTVLFLFLSIQPPWANICCEYLRNTVQKDFLHL